MDESWLGEHDSDGVLRGCVGVLVWPSGLDLGLGLGQVTGAASSYPLRTDCTAVHLVHCTYLH